MKQHAIITVRVHPKLMSSASRVLRQAGVSTSDAIGLFLKQVVLQGGLPFEAPVPNARARWARRATGNPARFTGTRSQPRAKDPLEPAFEAWARAREKAAQARPNRGGSAVHE